MSTSTTNLHLTKPAGNEDPDISVSNGNMDKIDAYAGATNTAIANIQDGLAIIADGDSHAAIASGQFVYVKNNTHSLADGLYVATAAISENGEVSSSNVTADSNGGLNALNSIIPPEYITFGSSSKSITANLQDNWMTAVPNDSKPHPCKITAQYGVVFGYISRYETSYGICVISRYDGNSYILYLNNGTISEKRVASETVTTGTITKSSAASGGALDTTSLYKVGSIVFATGRIHSLNNVATNNAFFVIPEGFRPARTSYTYAYSYVTNQGSDLGSVPVFATIDTSGNVNFTYPAQATTTQVFFSGSWSIV